MFDLTPAQTNSVKPKKSSQDSPVGKDRGLSIDLPAERNAYLVELTGEDDPVDAKNWKLSRKLIVSFVLGFDTLIATWGSSIYSAAVAAVSEIFGVSSIVATLGLTLYICGFAVGPVVFAPLSELYGRKIPITASCFIFTCFMFACRTAKDLQTLMLCRFFAGTFAACPLAVVGVAFSDLFGNETRGIAITVFAALVFIGPFISPIVGVFITQSYLGWRWTEYTAGIMGAFAFMTDLFVLEEIYEKSLLRKRAAFIRVETGNFAIHHISEEEVLDFNDFVHKHLMLPLKLLFLEPIVLLITIYTAFIYGILYLFLEAYLIVFAEIRGINEPAATLPYLELILGVLIGCGIVVAFEPRYNRKLQENGGVPVPEQWLIPMMIGAIIVPVGLFGCPWTGNYSSVDWVVPACSGLLAGAGILTVFLQALIYLVDAYLTVAASSIAANTFLRSFFGAGFPLFATAMFHNLGVEWAGSLLGFLGVAFLPISFAFYIFGKRLRVTSSYVRQPI